VNRALSLRSLAGALGIIVILIALNAVVAGQNMQINRNLDQEVIDAQTIQTQIEHVNLSLTATIAEHRGYLLSGRLDDLRAYLNESTQLDAGLTVLRDLTRVDVRLRSDLGRLSTFVATVLNQLRRAVDLYRYGRARAAVHTAMASQSMMVQAEQVLAHLRSAASTREQQGLASARRNAQGAELTLEGMALATGVLVVLIAVLVWRSIARTRTFAGLIAWEHIALSQAKRHTDNLLERVRTQADLIQLAHDAIIVRDHTSVITFWNRGAMRLYGWPAAEALGRPIHDLLHTVFPTSREEVDIHLFREGAWMGELIHTARDGALLVVESRQAMRWDEHGRPAAIMEINRDISARKRAEDALRQANVELVRASRAKSEFLATISHEIRTPLNGVIGLTSLLLGTPLSPQQREYTAAIQTSGEALLALINDILDLSKIEAGQMRLERGPLDLRHLVGEVAAVFMAQVQAKGLRLEARVDPRVPPLVEGDAMRLREVLTNLVGNAVKFTAQGTVEVRVALAEESAEGVLLRIAVRDTGIGIAPEAQEALFEPFAQADASTTRRYGGTGLGLAIVKRLVEAMGGQIGVQSAVGQGSTFWLTLRLPRLGAAAAERPPATPHIGPAPRTAEVGARGRVLVAEDNAINRLVAAGLLESLGCEVHTVEDGRQAVEAVEREDYDLVLMDAHMPELDGFAATAAIRERERAAGRGRHTPIVALTADALAGDAEKSRAAGMDDHLSKPVTRERLAEVVEDWIDDSGRH